MRSADLLHGAEFPVSQISQSPRTPPLRVCVSVCVCVCLFVCVLLHRTPNKQTTSCEDGLMKEARASVFIQLLLRLIPTQGDPLCYVTTA